MVRSRCKREVGNTELRSCGIPQDKSMHGVCRECNNILLRDGAAAMKAVREHQLCEEVENVIEANVLLSGLGFINGGLAAAHGLHSGFSEIKESEKYLHGEKVAFALLCQMVLENAPEEEQKRITGFMNEVGLPVTLAQIGSDPTDDNMEIILNHTLDKNVLVQHEPFPVSKESLRNAILQADARGREYIS